MQIKREKSWFIFCIFGIKGIEEDFAPINPCTKLSDFIYPSGCGTLSSSQMWLSRICAWVTYTHRQAGRRSGLVKMEQIQTQQSNHPFSSSIIHWLSTLWSKRLWSIVRTQREAGENWRLRRIDMWNHKETWRKVSDRWWRCKPFSNKSKPTGLRQAYQQFFFSWKIWMPSAPMQQMSLPILQSLNLSWPI